MSGKIVFVEGVQGCGKTTFCKSYIAMNSDAVILEEWVDEKFLAEYIADMKNKAEIFQQKAQEELFKKLKNAIELAKQGKTVLIDRGIIGNRCFAEVQYAKGFISDAFMDRYRTEFTCENAIPDDVMYETWYLKCDVDTAMTRIKNRNRDGEDGYTVEYLKTLMKEHDKLLNSNRIINMNRKLKVSTEGLVDIRELISVH